MPRTRLPTPTVDEVIALLKRTSLPTIIVEGSDDLIIYNKLETKFQEKNVSVLPVGGRKNVLSIYERLGELPLSSQVLFVADKDNWVITGIPNLYQSPKLFFTNGYAIENDVFQDADILAYMSPDESACFNVELNKFLSWYALALTRHFSNAMEEIKIHPNRILDDINEYNRLTTLKVGELFPQQQLINLADNYSMFIRGKSLMQLAMRQLSYAGRAARHAERSFIEHVSVRPGPLIEKIFGDIGAALR